MNNNPKNINQLQTEIAIEEKPIDAAIAVHISSDKLHAFLELQPPQYGGIAISEQLLQEALNTAGITYGIDQARVQTLALQPTYYREIEIAKGIAAVNGIDGTLTHHVTTNRTLRPKEREDGTVNFWELDILQNVTQGDHLCTLVKATEGTEGSTVYSSPIAPKPGITPLLPLGKNITHNEEKTMLYAGISGNLVYKNKQLHVEPIFHVNGDVDISTGNINFIGTVVVTGNVREGFSITANGDITIHGMVEAAKLKSEGNITIRGGVFGSTRADIHCKGNLKCKYLESATITCKGDITTEYMVNSTVICEGEVELIGQRALIAGGEYIVLKKIVAKSIGTSSGTPTKIQLGSYGTIMEKKKILLKEFEDIEANEGKLQQVITYLMDMKKRGITLPADREKMLIDSVHTKEKLTSQKGTLQTTIEEMDQQIGYEGKQSLSCSRVLYRGTTITIKNAIFVANQDYTKKTFYYDDIKGTVAVSDWA